MSTDLPPKAQNSAGNAPVSSDAVGASSLNSSAHMEAASWRRGWSTLLRITRMTLQHPRQVALALSATIVAASLQLLIPQLFGLAIERTKTVFAGGIAGTAAQQAFWTPALLLLAV